MSERELSLQLRSACILGDVGTVRSLIAQGVNPSLKDVLGITALHYASWRGHLEVVQLLLSVNAEMNVQDNDGWTPLHWACRKGHLEVIKQLNKDGANLEAADNTGRTPLHRACLRNQFRVAWYLIRDQHCSVKLGFSDARSLLDWADQNDILQHLNSEQLRHIILEKDDADALLLWASRNGHLEVVKHLITEQHCNVHRTNKDGQTLLHLACQWVQFHVAWYLIRDQHCSVELGFSTARSLLDWANRNGILQHLNSEQLRHIILEKDDAEALLLWASRDGHLEVVKHLITEQHCNIQCRDKDGWTTLHLACRRGCTEVVKYLLREGHCNPNATDKYGTTPLAVTPSEYPAVIRELLRHGAHASDIYEHYGKQLPDGCPRKPTESAVKVFIVGKQGMGKSTLTTALKKEGGIMTYVMNRMRQVSGIEINTAGIIPHDIHSKTFGHATIYDFAGHEEFYSGHDVMLRSSIAGSPAVFLLVSNLSLSDEEFKQSIVSWLAFLENQDVPKNSKAHIIIVGSHVDEVTPADVENKEAIVSSLLFSSFHFAEFVPIDCRYAESPSMTKLRKQLLESCSTLRYKTEISVNCHCLYLYLLDQFQNLPAIRVREALNNIQEESGKSHSSESGILSCIPDDPTHLCRLLQDLHERGNILLLRDPENFKNSWIILDGEAILSHVTGTVFAQNPSDFKKCMNVATSTGVVPFSKIQSNFPNLDSGMIVEFLCHFEFCHEVLDTEGQQLLQVATALITSDASINQEDVEIFSSSPVIGERFFFFPHLLKIDVPGKVWEPSDEFSYYSGWILECSDPDKFLTHRFLHVLLLRLAFAFALAPDADSSSADHLAIQRKCSIWKNGIHWGDRSGTEALVEVVNVRKTVNVILRCSKGKEIECVRLRSSLIHKIVNLKNELCSGVPTSELFVHPSDAACYPLKSVVHLKLVSYAELATAITEAKGNVVSRSGQTMDLNMFLYFEPYAHLGEQILQQLFDEENSVESKKTVSDEFLHYLAESIHQKSTLKFIDLFKPSSALFLERMHQDCPGPTHVLVKLLKTWRGGSEGSYQCLHKKLDKYSVFAGRHPLNIAGKKLPSLQEISTSRPDLWSPEKVDQTILDINMLSAVNSELVSVAPRWMDLGLSLGLDPPTLELIASDHPNDANRCLTEVLAKWLQQVRTARSWRAITLALMSPSISEGDLAHSIAMSHGIGTPKESDTRYQDITSERLGISDLGEVSDEIFTIYEWFHLGLSLGLSYDTLRTIEKDCHQDTQHCRTEMLKAWLKGVGGESSWRQLACALDSPLIRRTEIASMIATGHKV